jgi:D-tyrosyl-tRNA(Tyr) deacylase
MISNGDLYAAKHIDQRLNVGDVINIAHLTIKYDEKNLTTQIIENTISNHRVRNAKQSQRNAQRFNVHMSKTT